ncbi:MAG: hypothetical protein KAX38_04335, partial [Candidatus Krumholzibacteria bacterium]|nr:hypothetical protein [Candidatus Krumholzibacteria bacterium]
LNPIVTFKWIGRDPIDTPWNYQDVDSIRHLWTINDGYTVYNLNKHPEMFEELWSPWVWYQSPSDSGKQTTIGDDEILEINTTYAFVLQAKDEAGAITSVFDTRTNVRQFMPLENSGPHLHVYAPYLGYYSFIGKNATPVMISIIAGFPLTFFWEGGASHYGGFVASYRYGWDIEDLNNPDDWDVHASPFHTSAPEKKFYFSTHTLYIEAVDNFGTVTLGQFEINILPVVMTKDLLWIDDFPSGEFYPQVYAFPQESEHDEFWINICERVPGFNPENDIYDTKEHFLIPPSIELIFKYKNIIWTYSTEGRSITWDDIVHFTIGTSSGGYPGETFNYVSAYLKAGGHLWTLGKSDRAGGLATVVPANARVFPMNLKCEIFGNTSGCTDTSGVNCMAYRDYCVTVLDKVSACFRVDGNLPKRDIDQDAMNYGYKDDLDPVTAAHPDLPDELHLWDKVTEPGNFFDPMARGFLYVEAYDPEYWMSRNLVSSQPCLHPMYRMKTRNTKSCLTDAVVAFWTTKYANVLAEAPGTVAAPSVHFGLPLWFFDRDQANAIADVIFTEWQIKQQLF